MAEIKAVILDLYGTLIYLKDKTNPYLRLFTELGLQSCDELKQARKIALTQDFNNLEDFIKKIRQNAKINLQTYKAEIQKEISSAELYSETKKVLEELKIKNFKLGLISNLASPYKKPFYDLGLDKYFTRILFSCETGLIKPDPKIYFKMLQDLNINPANALMAGDKISADFDGPKAIGMQAISLNRIQTSTNSISTLEGIFKYI